jgi:hypothetical protein
VAILSFHGFTIGVMQISATRELELKQQQQQPDTSMRSVSDFQADELSESEGWLASVFGVLFIMCKEAELPIFLMYAGVAIDFVQVSSQIHRY